MLLLIFTISLVAGFLMASSSMMLIINGVDEKYHVEDGRFTTNFELGSDVREELEALGCTLYENNSYDLPLTVANNDTAMKVRVYENRTEIDLPAYFEGTSPSKSDEIALDRVFCSNNDVQVGDTVKVQGEDFVVCGIMSLSDYQALFENNTDFVLNAMTFTVAQVSKDCFSALGTENRAYTYSFVLDDRSFDDAQRVDFEQDMIDLLGDEGVTLSDFVDRDANQGIGYAKDDMEGDSVVWMVLLYMLIAILAFVFVVLTSSTVEAESSVIGTLLANGYRKGELVRHYLTLPLICGLVGAVAGNVIGLTFMIERLSGLYYNSYSMPPFQLTWDWGLFAQSTLLPLAILVVMTLVGLLLKLRCTPLAFLRHETSKQGRRGGHVLPSKLGFATRFRLRVFGRNLPNFATLFVGILFASMLLLFGFCLMPTISLYADNLAASLVSEHSYALKAPVELDGTDTQREQYAAALKLSDMVDTSSIDEDEVEEKLSGVLEEHMTDDVRSQLEDLVDTAALQLIVTNKATTQLTSALSADAAALQEEQDQVSAQVAALPPEAQVLLAQASSMSSEELAKAMAALPPDQQSALQQAIAASQKLASDASALQAKQTRLTNSLVISLTEYGLGTYSASSLSGSSSMDSAFEDIDTDDLNWQRLKADGILKSTEIDLTSYGLGVVDLATFDVDNISLEDVDFEAMDTSYIDFDEIGLGGVNLGNMSKNEFFTLLQKTTDIDEDANAINSLYNSPQAIAQAEKFVSLSLEYGRGGENGYESVTLYGIANDSRYYADLPLDSDKVTIGRGLSLKFGLSAGDSIDLYDKYENATYTLTIGGVWGSDGNMNAYLPLDKVNSLAGNDADFFSGYLSNEELNIDGRYLAADMTPAEMDKITMQMEDSMDDTMGLIVFVALAIYLVLMYLLTKIIIEHSARNISYMKVFGYRDREVNKLYLRSIAEVVVVSLLVSIPIVIELIRVFVKIAFVTYNGNFTLSLPLDRLVLEVVLGLLCFAVVAFLHARHIKKIPLALALKIQE